MNGIQTMPMRSSGYLLASLLVLAAVCGCGGGLTTLSLKGKVSQDGQAVNGGNLVFVPSATDGKAAATSPVVTRIQQDGTFNVQVVAGQYTVQYEAPQISGDAGEWDGKGAPPQMQLSPYAGLVVKQKELDISAGNSDLTIELVKPGA
jgi:hypothetical protein